MIHALSCEGRVFADLCKILRSGIYTPFINTAFDFNVLSAKRSKPVALQPKP